MLFPSLGVLVRGVTVVLVNKTTVVVGAAVDTAAQVLGSEIFESIGVLKVVITLEDVAVADIPVEEMAADFSEVTHDLFVEGKLETVSDTAVVVVVVVVVVDMVSAEPECIGELFAVTDSRPSETTFDEGSFDIGALTEIDPLET